MPMKIWTSLVVVGLWALAAWPQSEADTLPVFQSRDRIIAPVFLNGTGPYSFLVDSGLTDPVLSPGVAGYLGIATAGNNPTANFRFGGLAAHPRAVSVVSLATLSQSLGLELAGLLPLHQPGMAAYVDAASGRVSWVPLEAVEPAAPEGLVAMRIGATGMPQVHALVEGDHLRALEVDLNLRETLALSLEELKAIGALQGGARRLRTAGSPEADPLPGDVIRLEKLKVGKAVIYRPLCRVSAPETPGALGLGFFRNFRAILLYEAGELRLEAVRGWALEESARVGYGLSLHHLEDGFWRLTVAQNTPASEAGVSSGALLLAVGALELTGAEKEPNARARDIEKQLYAQEGAPLEIRVRQDGEERKYSLRAVPLL
jgi:hypothetical protein